MQVSLRKEVDKYAFKYTGLTVDAQRRVVCPSCGRQHYLDHGVILIQCECGFVALPEVSKLCTKGRNIAYRVRAVAEAPKEVRLARGR